MSDEPGVDPIFDEANRLFDEEKYEDAIKLYDKLIAEKKLGSEPFFMKAECFSNLNRYEDSLAWYDKAIDIDDENASIWNGKGNALYHLGNYGQARVCFECAYDLEPSNMDYNFSIIEAALLTGDVDDAVNMARDALRSTIVTSHVAMAWGFSTISLFVQSKPMNALETIDEFIRYMHDVEGGLVPGDKFTGVDYDLCGVEKFVGNRLKGRTGEIVQAMLSFLKGDVGLERLDIVLEQAAPAIALDDVVDVAGEVDEEPDTEEYPDFHAIADPAERAAIEQIDGLVKEFAAEVGFQSFAYIFEEYNWNQDRGPAPFLDEILNRFFVEIVDGRVTRLSVDLDLLAATFLPDGQKEAKPDAATYALAGELLKFANLEELFVTANRITDLLEAMRAARFGKGKEITLFVNVELVPGEQEDLVKMYDVEEIGEIDEIPADFQLVGKRVVGSMVWTATR